MSEKLARTVKKRKKRVGRGYGSGRGGHTAGRGQKGQKARSNLGILFEGVKVKKSLIKRLPLRRGKGKFKAKNKPLVIKLAYLNILPHGSVVDLTTLIKHNIVDAGQAKKYGVKILGDGDLKKKLTIKLPISGPAGKKVVRAGGKILSKEEKKKPNR